MNNSLGNNNVLKSKNKNAKLPDLKKNVDTIKTIREKLNSVVYQNG